MSGFLSSPVPKPLDPEPPRSNPNPVQPSAKPKLVPMRADTKITGATHPTPHTPLITFKHQELKE